ncbi:hypothetical protein [Polynucleobacter sp. HIN7]|uniref:hypothetical protein n=1 Tax=Polynucleobacter sp. HIN7 TaxID=3047866 RepID=UPI0025748F65|nr:hypothetical protein [Polynucleobacter sp. HIN7]BEI37623.1 hypothetical protein PHIN7_13470 [Polynucleobacter sp. HIN7]
MKKATAIKRVSGPNTERGKLISSQNAIKTGLTAKQLLNEQEFRRFSEIKENLNNFFSGENPLIGLQTERVARIHIQLERIQNAIDILYRKVESSPPQNSSKFDRSADIIFNLELKIMGKVLDKSVLDDILESLIAEKIAKLSSQNSDESILDKNGDEIPIITQKSLLGCYLACESEFYKLDVNDYLQEKIKAIKNATDAKELYKDINLEVLYRATKKIKAPDLKENIYPDDFYEYRLFQNWFDKELSKVSGYLKILEDSMNPDHEILNIPLPNFEELDRLMRYQTTLTRQLSTAIGELRILAA